MHSDSKNTVYLLDYYSEYIGKMDFTTGKTTLLQTPHAGFRTLAGDTSIPKGRVWFGEYRGNRIGMLDPLTDRFSGMGDADSLQRPL